MRSITPSSGEICRYILSDGKDTIGWYFSQVLATTPAEYLSEKCMYNTGNWGSDVELMAASALLKTDIYVANKIYRTDDSITKYTGQMIALSIFPPSFTG